MAKFQVANYLQQQDPRISTRGLLKSAFQRSAPSNRKKTSVPVKRHSLRPDQSALVNCVQPLQIQAQPRAHQGKQKLTFHPQRPKDPKHAARAIQPQRNRFQHLRSKSTNRQRQNKSERARLPR